MIKTRAMAIEHLFAIVIPPPVYLQGSDYLIKLNVMSRQGSPAEYQGPAPSASAPIPAAPVDYVRSRSVVIWFYAYPIGAFYLFGTVEGSWWVAATIALSTAFLFFDAGQYRYHPDAALRYMVTYLIVSIVSFAVECSRRRCYEELLKKTR